MLVRPKSHDFRILGKAVRAADEDVHQSRQAIEKAHSEKIKFDEANPWGQQQLGGAGAFAARDGLFCGQGGVTILFGEIGLHGFGRVMQQIARQITDRHGRHYFFVHRIVRPSRMVAMKQPQTPIGIAFAVTQITTHETVAARESPGHESRCGECGDDRFLQALTHAFIGINTEYPVMSCLFNSKLLLRPEAPPRRLNDPRTVALREFGSAIRAAGINDNDLVAKGNAPQAFLKLQSCVEDDKDGGKRMANQRLPGTWPVL